MLRKKKKAMSLNEALMTYEKRQSYESFYEWQDRVVTTRVVLALQDSAVLKSIEKEE